MNDFKPFYLTILLPLSVILFYFSFKTIVLLTILAVIGVCGSYGFEQSLQFFQNVLTVFYTESIYSVNEKKKHSTKLNSSSKGKRLKKRSDYSDVYQRGGVEMATVKLTPVPKKQLASVSRNQSFSLSPYQHRSYLNDTNYSLNRSEFHLSSSPRHNLNVSTPIIPTIKRALGLSEYVPRQDQPTVGPTHASHPSHSSPGFVPAVRLLKQERSHQGYQKSPIRSPNVVRIAPPEPHKLSSPRLFHIQPSNVDCRRTPDTQAVISALKEKTLKRTYGGFDLDTTYSDYPIQQAKRRRQDSQQSNSSTSSLPPLPDSLPDLSSSGYTIPRLETPTLKRSALVDDWEDSCSAKRLRKDGRVNSILSSLSSSMRIAEKDKYVKRKVTSNENKENNESKSKQAKKDNSGRPSLDRSDTVMLTPEDSVATPSKGSDSSVDDKSLNSSPVTDKPKLDKKITLNQSFSARKRQMSLYSGLNKSFQKVPHANVIASMEDYENDMGAEKKRVQDMLEEIHQAETDKEKEKKKKEDEEKAKQLASVAPPPAATQALQTSKVTTSSAFTMSSAPGLTGTSTASTAVTGAVNPVSSSTTVASSAPSFNFSSTKTTTSSTQPGLFTNIPSSVGVSTSLGSNTTTVTSSGFALSTGFSAGTQSAGTVPSAVTSANQPVTASAGPQFNFGVTPGALNTGTSAKASSVASAPFNFGTTVNSSTTSSKSAAPSGFNFGVASSACPSNTTQSTTPFGLQQQATSQSQPVPPFGGSLSTTPFGMPAQTTASFGPSSLSSTPFGQTATTSTTFSTATNPTASTLNFKPFAPTSAQPSNQTTQVPSGNHPPTGTPAFGAFNTSTTTQGPVFGSTTSSFGQKTGTSTSAGSGGFNFGGSAQSFGNQAPTGFGQSSATAPSGFGQPTATAPSGFGQPTAPTPTGFGQPTGPTPTGFGQPTAPTPTGFGQSTAPSVFGQPTAAAPTPAFGSSNTTGFGQTTAQQGFGTGSTTFGTSTTAGSSFGQGTNIFGTGATTKASSNMFGTANTTSSSGFGTTFGQGSTTFGTSKATTGPTFGAPTQSFGQGTASFGPATTTASGFGSFGQGASSFGTSKTSANSGSTFGFSATPSTQQTKAGFSFGSTQSAAPSTPKNKTGGFDFSASATPSNASGGGFNFSANASFSTPTGLPAPVFGTPTGGTPNMFNASAAGSIPKPRVAQRARRRGGKPR